MKLLVGNISLAILILLFAGCGKEKSPAIPISPSVAKPVQTNRMEVHQTPDGGYIAGGDGIVIKIDPFGNYSTNNP